MSRTTAGLLALAAALLALAFLQMPVQAAGPTHDGGGGILAVLALVVGAGALLARDDE